MVKVRNSWVFCAKDMVESAGFVGAVLCRVG